MNKIIGLFSFGLLMFAATITYAKADTRAEVSDAWTFMEENTKDKGAGFKAHIGGERTTDMSKLNKERKCFKGTKKTTSGEIIDAEYCVKATNSEVTVTEKTQGLFECGVIAVEWYNNRKCRLCPMLGVLYDVADSITVMAHKNFARSFAIVIVVGLAIWIAFKTLVFVTSLSKQDAAKYFTELFMQTFKFFIAYFGLMYYDYAFSELLLPLLKAGLSFGTTFVEAMSLDERFGSDFISALSAKDITTLKASSSEVTKDYIMNVDNVFFNGRTYAYLENFAFNVNMHYSLLQTLGGSLWCTGTKLILEIEMGLAFACMLYGLAFALFGLILCIGFIFYLLDAIVQLGIVGGLMPFLIASWPFKLTAQYTKTGFNIFLNSVFTFMLMGVIADLSVALINVAIEANTSGGSKAGADGIAVLIEALNSFDKETLNIYVNVLTVGFLMFLFANIMAVMLLGKVREFTNTFASGGMSDIGSGLGAFALSAAKGAASKVAAPTVNAAKDYVSEKVENAYETVKEKAHEKINQAGSYMVKKVTAHSSAANKFVNARNERLSKEQQGKQQKLDQNKQDMNDFFNKNGG